MKLILTFALYLISLGKSEEESSKIIVIGGFARFQDPNSPRETEIIDLENIEANCVNWIDYPNKQDDQVVGGLVSGQVFACGGYKVDSCFIMDQDKFTEVKLLEERDTSASISLGDKLWITGGFNVTSSEYVTKHGSEKGPDLPIGPFGHSMAKISENEVIITGGSNEFEDHSDITFVLRTNGDVELGPRLTTGRNYHTSGMIVDEFSGKRMIFVYGGYKNGNGFVHASTYEVWVEENGSWQSFDYPGESYSGASLIEYNGGLVLIGGVKVDENGNFEYNPDITFIKCLVFSNTIPTCYFEKLPQKLQYPRAYAAVFRIPDELANCQ